MTRRPLKLYVAAAVSVATFMVYLFSLKNEFLQWDDTLHILENPHIRSLDPSFFRWAFFDFYAGNWHPLSWMSLALDYAVWELNPMGYHLTNNLLHAVNTFVVVLLVVKLMEVANAVIPACPESFRKDSRRALLAGMTNQLGLSTETKSILIAAATTGLLFGLHPVHVESVAWVSERKDLLCALFFLLSVMTYLSYVSDRSNKSYKTYILSLLFFILALLSKPMAVTLPLVLLILDWYPLGRIQSLKSALAAITGKFPFIVLSLASAVLTVLAQGTGGAIKSTGFAPMSTRLLVGMKSLVMYLWKMVLPVDLVPFYPYPEKVSLLSLEYLPAAALVTGITIACLIMAKRQKLWLSAWAYYVITLLPVLGIVQVGLQSMADRYTYLPGLGPFLVLGVMAASVRERIKRAGEGSRFAGYLIAGASVAVIISLSFLTVRQIGVWRDSIVLWSYVIEKEPGRVLLAYLNRGMAYERAGRIDKAIEDYDKAISIDPLYFEAYNNRGVLYGQEGKLDKAIEYFNKSIDINPGDEDAYIDRGIAYALSGRYAMAMEDFSRAVFLNPGSAEAFFNRGSLHLRAGDRAQAAADFRKACDLGKEDACARVGM